MKSSFRAYSYIILFSLSLLTCGKNLSGDGSFQTPFEESGGLETPRYAETMDYFRRLNEASPQAKMIRFGMSPEGRDLNLFIISSDRAFSPKAALASGKPVVLIQCCIHPGESEGKDAAMMLARDLLIGGKYPELLERIIITIIPIFNVDGHERFGPYNRINQNGPKEMGWRVTATRLNLNRDFIKADAPEMRAWLALFNQWKPHLFIDCHTTDGADFQYVLTYNIDTHEEFGGTVSAWAKNALLPALKKECESKKLIIGPYAALMDELHPEKGLKGGVWRPMLSNPYATLRNRAGLLIETHSLKPYAQRVQATYDFILAALSEVARHPQGLLQAVAAEDERSAQLGRKFDPTQKFPLRFQLKTDRGDSMIYRGYRFDRKVGRISGSEYLEYSKENRDIPSVFFNDVETEVAIAPPLGYLIPQQWTTVIDVLQAQGIRLQRLREDVSCVFQGYRFSEVQFRPNSYEGRQTVNFKTEITKEKRSFPAGTVYASLGCSESKLIMNMLEPQAPDALVGWGFFNTIFENREYFEDYVMEPLAERMAAEDSLLLQEFESRLAADTSFAHSPAGRLQFFYDRSPYRDAEKNLYPIFRVTEPIGTGLLDEQQF